MLLEGAITEGRVCLVLGGATHSTLAAARSIARTGVPAYVGTIDRRSVPVFRASRWVSGVRHVKGRDPEAVAAELTAFADEAFPTATEVLVISTSERVIDHLDAARDRLDARFTLAIPPAAVCADLLDKSRSLALAGEAGLQVPPWASVGSAADIDALPELRFPVCVRPTAWNTTGDTSFKIEICETPAALRTCLDDAVAGGGTFIVQEYVGDADGLDVAIVWAAEDGAELRTWTGRKRRSSSAAGGVLAWGETTALPDVDAGIRAFASSIAYTGIGGIEFLRVGDDLWFIEFNPRLEAFHRLAAVSGLDAPALAAAEWCGATPEPGPVGGSAAMWVGGAWADRLAHDPRGAALYLADGARYLGHRRHACSIWDRHDPRPAFAALRARAERRARLVAAKVRRRG